ncbi:hypothetical protein ACA910_017011 [Epithemia clementina (nom. ined.)]
MPRIIPSSKKRKGVAGLSLGDVLSEAEIQAAEMRAAAPFRPYGRDDSFLHSHGDKYQSKINEQDQDHTGPLTPHRRVNRNRGSSTVQNPKCTPPRQTENQIWVMSNSSANGENAANNEEEIQSGANGEALLRTTPERRKVNETTALEGQGGFLRTVEHDFIADEERTESLGQLPCPQCKVIAMEIEKLRSTHDKELEAKESMFKGRQNDLGDEIEKLQKEVFTRLLALFPEQQPDEHENTEQLLELILLRTEQKILAQSERIRDLEACWQQAQMDLENKTQETILLMQQEQEYAAILNEAELSLDKKTKEWELLMQEKQEFSAKLTQAESDLTNKTRENHFLVEENKEYATKLRQAELDLITKTRENHALVEENKEYATKLRQVELDLTTKTRENHALEQENQEYAAKLKQAKLDLTTKTRENHVLMQENKEYAAKLRQSELDLTNKTRENHVLVQENKECAAQLKQRNDSSVSSTDTKNAQKRTNKRTREEASESRVESLRGYNPNKKNKDGMISVLETLEKRHGECFSSRSSESTLSQALFASPDGAISDRQTRYRERIAKQQAAVESRPSMTMITGVSKSALSMSTKHITRRSTIASSREVRHLWTSFESSHDTSSATSSNRSCIRKCTRTAQPQRLSVVLTKTNSCRNKSSKKLCETSKPSLGNLSGTRATQAHVEYHANFPIYNKPQTRSASVGTREQERQPLNNNNNKKNRGRGSLLFDSTTESSVCSI